MTARAFEFPGTDRFQVLQRLGQGGMGVVYQALDRERNTVVALKLLSQLGAEQVLRFKNEFRALADLQHPNLCSLGELISERGQWFFTMELVAGIDFLAHVRRDRSVLPALDLSGDISVNADTLQSSSPARKLWAEAQEPRGPVFEESRLRSALGQLTRGLMALHRASKVHRDIKPSNVLVTPEGRVVLLDFGFAVEVTATGQQKSDVRVVGTVDYMAPEQAASKPVGPEADWYSVGVILYEALTGRVPFAGPALEVLMKKQQYQPKSPRSLVPSVPIDLDALCMDLLKLDPALRPSGREILTRGGVGGEDAGEGGDTNRYAVATPAPQLSPFVGRQRELSVLADALGSVRRGNAVTVFVHGESGVGKTALVRRFTEGLGGRRSGTRDVVVLSGRCYEKESVPYKAFDGVIDSLSRYLMGLARDEATAVLPRRMAHLAQVFPVLRRVEAVAKAPLPTHEVVDPQELRNRVFAALRELLGRLAERSTLVLVIDDLQWADADSMALLAEIMRQPEAPPLLLLATMRRTSDAELPGGEPRGADPMNDFYAAAGIRGDVRRVHVEGLPEREARELAQMLIEQVDYAPPSRARPPGSSGGMVRATSARTIAAEADGHPLFIHELVRHALASGAEGGKGLRLEDALTSRVHRLEPSARLVLELICVNGTPLEQGIGAHAASCDFSDFTKDVAMLRIAHLVRTTGTREGDAIEPYHDRVRAAVMAQLDPAGEMRLHERLALALEGARRADAEALSVHWHGAGNEDKAARYAAQAAAEADGALAFNRAVRLYRLAIELGGAGSASAGQAGVASHGGSAGTGRGGSAGSTGRAGVAPLGGSAGSAGRGGVAPLYETRELPQLRSRLGSALANSGRGGEAAREYLAAAELLPPSQALELQRRAAEQLLISGHIDEGIAVIRIVLAAVDMTLPDTPKRALARLLFYRARLRLRGMAFRPRDVSEISPDTLTRIDICRSVATGLGFVDNIRAVAFQTRHFLLALASGEPIRVSRALSVETAYVASRGGRAWRRTQEMMARGRELAHSLNEPYAIALHTATSGLSAFLVGQWKLGLAQLDEAQVSLRDRCTGVAWEVDSVQIFGVQCLSYLGEIAELARRVPLALREAIERGDIYLGTSIRTVGVLAWLSRDEVDVATSEVDEAARQWSQNGFHIQHHYLLMAQSMIDLYRGDPMRAYERIQARWPALEASLLLRIQHSLGAALWMRGRIALAAFAQRGGGRAGDRQLLDAAERDAARLERERMPWMNALARLLRAGAAASRGDSARAVGLLGESVRELPALDMPLLGKVAERRLGQLIGGARGGVLVSEADSALSKQAIRRPGRLAALLVPGFSD